MGGGAFVQAAASDEPTLRTPRMSITDYSHLKATYTERLQAYFPRCTVSCLLEAPEKSDYGDIDFIVSTSQRVDNTDLARQIGARGVICLSSGSFQRCTLAVPLNGSKSERQAVVYAHTGKPQDSTPVTEEAYAQIDVEIIPPELFEWHMFYASYGDLAGLLGKFVHYFGFTVTDKGLLLRLQELDVAKATEYINVNGTSGKLFLSRDPDRVMEFLGLSPEKFHKGFTTMNQFYEWLGECRLLSPDTVRYRRNNSYERNREKKRTMYTRFLEEWLPAHVGIDLSQDEQDKERREESPKPDVTEKRQQLRDEATSFFDKQREFDDMHRALTLFIHHQTAAHFLKPILAGHSKTKDKKLAEILRAFRRWVVLEDGQPKVARIPHSDEESQLHLWLAEDGNSLRDVDHVSEWVKANWEVLKQFERQRLKDTREHRP